MYASRTWALKIICTPKMSPIFKARDPKASQVPIAATRRSASDIAFQSLKTWTEKLCLAGNVVLGGILKPWIIRS